MRMRKYMLFVTTIVLLLSFMVPTTAAPATRHEEALWADGQIWDTIITSATFKAPNNEKSVDKIYVVMNENFEGQRSVAEAAPYEKDYNGGRWWVQAVYFTDLGLSIHDADNDGMADFELTSDDAVLHHESLGHLIIVPTDVYFECPLLRA